MDLQVPNLTFLVLKKFNQMGTILFRMEGVQWEKRLKKKGNG